MKINHLFYISVFSILALIISLVFNLFYTEVFETKIIANHKDEIIIKNILNNTNKSIKDHISSISVTSRKEVNRICGSNNNEVLGCTIHKYYILQRLRNSDIYVSDIVDLDGACYTQYYIFYHEIGHVRNAVYKYNDSEYNAHSYAENFSKNYCIENYIS